MSQPSGNPYPHQPQQPHGTPQPPPAGQPWDSPAGAPAPPAPKKSKAGKIVLIVLAVVLVLCVGGGAIAWFAVKDEVNDVVDASNTRVVTPATLAGRPLSTDPELKKSADDLVTQMGSTLENETSTVGAFYGDAEKKNLVMVFAASGVMADPKKELDDTVAGIQTELAVTGLAAVEPGPLGGEARCGNGKASGTALGVCVWADRGSVGMIIMYFKTAEQAKAEFVAMRGQIEQRS